ncbi:MAG TPA: LysM peptidoglycan-binding domain-containing protein [Candidatus Dormibacteraeota bacterium]|nr:LysM peptidoglycan-binding domain-containing protein [Candidatus Dormibacteraeota bacterium]
MTKRFPWAALVIAGLAVSLAGCAARTRHAQVRPPVTLAPRAQATGLSHLPIARLHVYPSLVAATRPAIDVLIEQVEQDFEQGEQEYQADNLPQAKEHFDAAVNRLLESGLNFTADPRLQPLMDRLVNTMHDDQLKIGEIGAGSAANGGQEQSESSEAAAEPASPLEEIAAAANLPSNPEVSQKATAELLHIPHDLPLTVNQPVLTFLNYFQTPRGRQIIEHSLARSGRYMPMVQRVLKQEGVPQDLKYLPLCESGYQPRAMSRVGARGLWQFMPMRAREYGLKINQWEDQRMDPEDSTRAAAEHLRDLYGMFHDWYLALAAYDAGPLTVTRAIERTGYADFWQLYRLNALPVETKNYVPIMLAMTMVAKDPALYGVDISDPQKPIKTEAFLPGRSIDLDLVADAIGVNVDTLRNLNPELFGLVTPDDPTFALRIPAGTRNRLKTLLASIPQTRWVGWRLHRVEDGETLGTIAAKYHLQSASLAQANNIPSGDPLTPGRWLLVPAPVSPALIYYRVRGGDTVGGIAGRFRVSIYDLRLWNHLHTNLIRIGQELRIYSRQGGRPRFKKVSSHQPVHSSYPADSAGRGREGGRIYIVRSGDSFWSISRRYGTSVHALRAANPEVVRRGLKPGERIVIPK